MWYFFIEASPKPDTNQATESGGAHVNCWINFLIEDGAEHLARFYLDQAGWKVEKIDEARWVVREGYDDGAEALQYYSEAECDGASFVIHEWPINRGNEDD
jgi:hypothetical protein